MKSHPILVGLSTLLLAICVVVAPGIWDQLHLLYPTPETESAFLKNYTPKSVIEQFDAEVGSGMANTAAAEQATSLSSMRAGLIGISQCDRKSGLA